MMTSVVPWPEENSDSAFFRLEDDILLWQQWWGIRDAVLNMSGGLMKDKTDLSLSLLYILPKCFYCLFLILSFPHVSMSFTSPTCCHWICWCLFLLASSPKYILLLFFFPLLCRGCIHPVCCSGPFFPPPPPPDTHTHTHTHTHQPLCSFALSLSLSRWNWWLQT